MDSCFLRNIHNIFHNFSLCSLVRFVIQSSLEAFVLDSTVSNVVLDGVIEENTILRDNTDVVSQILDLNIGDVLAVN